MNSIHIDQLQIRRSTGFVLGPISLCLEPGSRTALVGPSGCGKTTLLRCIAGLETPDSGRITLGEKIVHEKASRVDPSQRGIGFVFQDAALWPHMTVSQHLKFVNPAMDAKGIEVLLSQVGLEHARMLRPDKLSGGEAQRLALARALATSPNLLLLDEPMQSVDVHLRNQLLMLIRQLARERNITLLLVTHDRDEALAIADRLVILRDGHLVEEGSTSNLLQHPRTAFTAAFLLRAACLPTSDKGNGQLLTPFGLVDKPATGDLFSLVLMPGDLVPAKANSNGSLTVEVIQVQKQLSGAIATVAISGQLLPVACATDQQPGSKLQVRLQGNPRILPADDQLSSPASQ